MTLRDRCSTSIVLLETAGALEAGDGLRARVWVRARGESEGDEKPEDSLFDPEYERLRALQ